MPTPPNTDFHPDSKYYEFNLGASPTRTARFLRASAKNRCYRQVDRRKGRQNPTFREADFAGAMRTTQALTTDLRTARWENKPYLLAAFDILYG